MPKNDHSTRNRHFVGSPPSLVLLRGSQRFEPSKKAVLFPFPSPPPSPPLRPPRPLGLFRWRGSCSPGHRSGPPAPSLPRRAGPNAESAGFRAHGASDIRRSRRMRPDARRGSGIPPRGRLSARPVPRPASPRARERAPAPARAHLSEPTLLLGDRHRCRRKGSRNARDGQDAIGSLDCRVRRDHVLTSTRECAGQMSEMRRAAAPAPLPARARARRGEGSSPRPLASPVGARVAARSVVRPREAWGAAGDLGRGRRDSSRARGVATRLLSGACQGASREILGFRRTRRRSRLQRPP